MDQYEPELNRDPPGDQRDTTTPRALATTVERLVLGDALPGEQRGLLTGWMREATPLPRIRAGTPDGWLVADKTGTGDYGRANDVAVLWPPGRAPIVLALLSDRDGYDTPTQQPLLADATRVVLDAFAAR